MATLSLTNWEQLFDLVSQFLATLVGLVLKSISTRTWAKPSRKPKRVYAPAARETVLKRTHAMFGTGGKVFLTDAPDGKAGGIRTLVQLDGHIVTRVTERSMLDTDLLGQHRAAIEAWFAKLNSDWRRLRLLLTGAAAALTRALTVGDVTTFSQASNWQLIWLALPTVPPIIGKVGSVLARRFMLHVARGPSALRPARSWPDELTKVTPEIEPTR